MSIQSPWADSKGLCPCSGLNYFYGAFLPVFLLICLVQSPYLLHPRILPCVHASFSQNRDYHRALLGSLPFDFQGAYCACLLISRKRNMWFGQEPSSTLNCPAVLVLEFLSMGNGSPVTLLGLGVREHLPPASVFAGYAVAPTEGPVLVSDNDVHLGDMCMRKNHLISRKEHTYVRLVQQQT